MSEYRCDICKEMTHASDFHEGIIKVNGVERLICNLCYEGIAILTEVENE